MPQKNNTLPIVPHGLPLLIGITGHRDLVRDDIPELKQRLHALLNWLQERYPDTPLMLMSALAEGADRLAAEVALEMGIPLIAPLPMSAELYEQDFSQESVTAFRNLLAQAAFSYVSNSEYTSTPDATFIPRDLLYQTVGRSIVQYSQILIALWDGTANGKLGGTADVVRLMLDGDDGDLCGEQIQPGTVFHLPVRRMGEISNHSSGQLLETYKVDEVMPGVHLLCPLSVEGASRQGEQQRILDCIQRYNLDRSQLSTEWHDYGVTQTTSSANLYRTKGVTLNPAHQYLCKQYSHADTLAQHFQKETYEVVYLLACLVPFIVVFFETYSNVSTAPAVIAGYLGSIILAYGIFRLARKHKLDDKYLDYRALAEGLRVSFYWRLAGINESPAAYYLNRQQSELDWIRYATRTIELLAFKGQHAALPSADVRQSIRTCWIDDQISYFATTSRKQKENSEQLELLATCFFRLGLFVVTPVMLLIHGLKWGGELLDPWLQVATPFCFIIAGAIEFYADRRLFGEQAKQYVRMFTIFSKGTRHLDQLSVNDLPGFQKVIQRLGQEALAENGDWLLMHRERPIEVPQG